MMIFRYIQVCSGHDLVATKESPRHPPDIFPCFHRVSISIRRVCNSAFLLPRVTPRLAQSRVYSSQRRSSRLSGGVRLTSCVTFLSEGTTCAKKVECFLQFLDSKFFGLESFDVNLGRNVVLAVVPMNNPTKLTKTKFVSRRIWTNHEKTFSPKWYHWTITCSSTSSFIRRLSVFQIVLYVSHIADEFHCFSPPLF